MLQTDTASATQIPHKPKHTSFVNSFLDEIEFKHAHLYHTEKCSATAPISKSDR